MKDKNKKENTCASNCCCKPTEDEKTAPRLVINVNSNGEYTSNKLEKAEPCKKN